MIARVFEYFRRVRRWHWLMQGFCPLCYSSPPAPSCPVCGGSHLYSYRMPEGTRELWWARFEEHEARR